MAQFPPPGKPPASGLSEILAERGKTYGDFTVQGDISQKLKETVRLYIGWERLSPHQREGIDMILHKVSRIVNGDPNFADSWQDIAGYAQLCADRCPKPQPPPTTR